MSKATFRHVLAVSACALVAAASPAVSAQSVSTGAFRNLASVDTTLLRGVTTKAEVRKQLGIPNGSGAARFYTLGGHEQEIWYYEDIEATGVTSGEQGVMRIEMRQQLLIVMFKGEMVDGYLWTSNGGTATAK